MLATMNIHERVLHLSKVRSRFFYYGKLLFLLRELALKTGNFPRLVLIHLPSRLDQFCLRTPAIELGTVQPQFPRRLVYADLLSQSKRLAFEFV